MEELDMVRTAFSWLPEEGLETLGACFDLTVEQLRPGESRASAGRGGCLLRGRGKCNGGILRQGGLLGIRVTERGEKRAEDVRFTAEEDCTILWFNFQLLQMVCYAACWFHVRFLKEIEVLLNQ